MAATSRLSKLTVTRNPPTSITAWHLTANCLNETVNPPQPFTVDAELPDVDSPENLSVVQNAVDDACTDAGFEAVDWTL